MIIKRILCLANSRKLSGRCIAGRELTGDCPGDWVRPISSREHQEVSEYERQYEDGTDPQVLDIIDVPLIEHQPKAYQQENWLLEPDHYWVKIRNMAWRELDGLAAPLGALWINGYSTYNGMNDKVPINVARNFDHSLELINVDGVTLSVFRAGLERPKRRVQALFNYGGTMYALWVTDPQYEREYLARSDGQYNLGSCFLTISLGEEFQGDCYKLVAAIIPRHN